MALNKSILLLTFISCTLSLFTQAHRHHPLVALSPSSSPPPSSYEPSKDNPCKPLLRFEFSFSHSPSLVNPILGDLCGATQNPIMCCTFLTPCLSAGTTVDSLSILNTLILQLSAQTEYAISFANGLCKSKDLSPLMIQSLEKSIDLYTDVVDELQDAIGLLKASDISAVKIMFTSAITKFGFCDEAFYQQGLMANSPLKRLNELLTELAGFGVDISAKLNLKTNT